MNIIVLAALVAAGLSAVPEAGWAASEDLGPFIDDDGHPGEPYLEWLAGLGAVQGCNRRATIASARIGCSTGWRRRRSW